MEKRSLFEKIFGKKTEYIAKNEKPFELISTTSSRFFPFSGDIFNNDIVRSAVRPTATSIGKLSPKHISGIEKLSVNSVARINNILRKPNPYMFMQEFLMKMVYNLELKHNAFAYVQKDDLGYVTSIYPIPYSSVEITEIGEEVFVKFRFFAGKQMQVRYTDLIHLRKDFYSNDFYGDSGESCLKNIMEIINTNDQGIVNAVKNSAVIKWILKFKSILKPEDRELQISDFIKNYLNISNSGGVAYSDPRYDLDQVEEKSYIPNATQITNVIQRLYSYFGVNDAIVQNKYTEDEWLSFYESKLEPIVIALSNAFTDVFFSIREKGFGNKIVFESSNLAYASMQTKLNLVQLVDRGALTPNEWRQVLNLAPIEGGDVPIRRLDTAEVDANKDTKKTDIKGNKEGDANKDGV